MKKIVAALPLILLACTVCLADIPRPDQPKKGKNSSIDTNLSIELDRNAKEARLIIPRTQVSQLRAELDAIDPGENDTVAAGGVTRMQTIVGGALLSLAFVFGGSWLVKSGRVSANNGKAAAAAAIVMAGGASAMVAFGNAGPPAEARSITGKMFSQSVHIYGFGWGKIKLEVSDEVQTPKLVVPDPPDAKKTEE